MKQRSSTLKFFAAGLALLFFCTVARADNERLESLSPPFFFKDGDAVVMIGDSITEQHLYSNYVEMWTVCRFPNWKITFRNVGIGGDRSPGGNGRFKRDVLYHKPTAMTVDFGMNDGSYQAFNEDLYKKYMEGLQGIAGQAKAANIRVAWLTPSPYERKEDGPAIQGYNETLERFSAGVKEIAAKNRDAFVDQFHPFLKIQDKARAASPKNRIGGGDEIHPGPPGQALMAWAILKGLQFPTMVSSVEIKLRPNGFSADTTNCTVTGAVRKDGGLRFYRQDNALPFFPEEAKSILEWAPILEELNQYSLKVTGLEELKRYEIRIGGQKVAEHTGAELKAAVNLAAAALKAGPVADQVKAVWKAVQDKNRYYHDHIFRGVVLAHVAIPDFLDLHLTAEDIEAKRRAAADERMKKMAGYDAAIQKALVMKPCLVEILPLEK
jgi:lysophospholipase L1-like esterase